MGGPAIKAQTADGLRKATALRQKAFTHAVIPPEQADSLHVRHALRLTGQQTCKFLGGFRDEKELARIARENLTPQCMQDVQVDLDKVIFNALQGNPRIEDVYRAANVDLGSIKINAVQSAMPIKRPGKGLSFFSFLAPKH